jgi:hypothetical protein
MYIQRTKGTKKYETDKNYNEKSVRSGYLNNGNLGNLENLENLGYETPP